MSLGNRLRNARKRVGYTQRQLAEKIGAKHNSVSNWENGLNMPDPVTIEQICDFLGITPNYLLLGEEVPSVLRGEFSSEEILLLNKYRRLDKSSRGAVDALVNYYTATVGVGVVASPKQAVCSADLSVVEPSAQKSERAILSGIISTQSVAAGTGTYLDQDYFDTISVEDNYLTRRASFYVPVSGNSMEPKYKDGQILIIEKSGVNLGEIGIFTLDGSGFVKIRGKGELISLNPKYSPIPMNDGIVCNGKVIGILKPEWIVI